ncbi:MAG: ABC transporter permease [Acidaminobacteraceae bacterium]
MNTISYFGIFYLSMLIIPTLFINRSLNIKMNTQIVISVVRMILQLSLVGFYLQYVFDLNNPIINVIYMLLMMSVATFSIKKSTGLHLKMLYLPILVSMAAPNFLMVLFFNTYVINLTNILDARYIITIGGMLLGNVLSGDIIGLNTYYRGISDNINRVNYDLALGATRYQATKPYFKDAITASIRPTVASMATIGLVSLPGMMTGQILGGSVPLDAIMYQIAIMIAIYVTRYINIYGAIILSQKMMFDSRDQLIHSL